MAELLKSRSSGARRMWKRNSHAAVWMMLGVPSAFLAVFLVVPLISLLFSSFQSSRRSDIASWTLDHYVAIFSDAIYIDPLLRSIKVGLLAMLACVFLAYPIAILMARSTPRARAYATLLLFSPLLASVVVRSFGWMILLGPSGALDSLGAALGWSETGGGILYSETAMIIGLVHVFVAFMVVTILASLDEIDPSVYAAARTLGARPLRIFYRVTLPLTAPGLLGGCVIVFALSSSAFITPRLLGGARNQVLAGVVYDQAMVTLNWPLAAAAAFVLLAITAAGYLLATRMFPSTMGRWVG